MLKRTAASALAALIGLQCAGGLAWADNAMGYRLLPQQEAAQLPRNGGTLGLEVGRADQISDSGLTFDVLKVKGVRSGSAGARAGFKTGDQIIAVDGRVFPSVAVFAAYVGSFPPGHKLSADYIPDGGGPQEAQRVDVVLGGARSMPVTPETANSAGLSTGTKVAIGVTAAALFGCYKLGCFSHKAKAGAMLQPGGQQ